MRNLWALTSAAAILAGSVAIIAVVNTTSAQQPDIGADSPSEVAKTPKTIRGLNSDQVEALARHTAPGAIHEQLIRKFSGTWIADYKLWFNPDEKEPYTAQATVEYKSICGGRYLQGTYSAKTPMPIEAQSTIGYDNFKREYCFVCIGGMGTGMLNLTGKFDHVTNVYTFEGNSVDVTARDVFKPCKEEFKCVDANLIQHTVWQGGNKIYEATLKRNKAVTPENGETR